MFYPYSRNSDFPDGANTIWLKSKIDLKMLFVALKEIDVKSYPSNQILFDFILWKDGSRIESRSLSKSHGIASILMQEQIIDQILRNK